MFKRYRKWRNRRWYKSLKSEVGTTLGGEACRVTYRKGRLIGVEIWYAQGNGAFGYQLFRGKK